MFVSILVTVLALRTVAAAITSTTRSPTATSTPARPPGLQYKLPDGYTITQQTGTASLDPYQIYGAAFVALLTLAYEDSGKLADPVSYPYPAISLNITGQTATSQYYRQFASYVLYYALETISFIPNVTATGFPASNFTLENKAGNVACKVTIGPPSEDWQRLLAGSSGGGLSPRDNPQELPQLLHIRQLGNESAALSKLTPLYASDWYGPPSTPQDFFMALATTIVKTADYPNKDAIINYSDVEKEGYHVNVTNVPLQSQVDYFTWRQVLGLCARAYDEGSRRVGYGTQAVRSFETLVLWTNGTEVVQQHVLRYEGQGGGKGV